MSNIFSGAAAPRAAKLPDGETVGSYGSYLDAQKAVDYLADHDFPVQHVSIVGNDLRSVEVVTGRLSYPRVALSGIARGSLFGLFIGLVLSLFPGQDVLSAILQAVLIGAVFWMVMGVIGYAAQRGKRDFSSVSQVIASTFDVVVDREVAGRARHELANSDVRTTNAAGPAGNAQGYWQPPQGGQPGPYGQPGQPQQPGPWGPPQQPGPNGQQGGQPGPWGPPQGQPGPYAGPNYQPQPGQPQDQPQQQPQPQVAPAQNQNDPAANDSNPNAGHAPGQFPDLPDGRPQYGVRVDGPQQPAPPSSSDSHENSGSDQNADPNGR